jgi:uncharacterized protein YkwD
LGRFGWFLAGALAAGCAVNPLTPTPVPTATLPPVVVVRVAATDPPVPTPTHTPAATWTWVAPTADTLADNRLAVVTEPAEAATAAEIEAPAPTVPLPMPSEPPPAPTTAPAEVAPPPTPVLVAAPPAADVAAAEQYTIDLINAQRTAAGLAPYARDETVMSIARARVADMVARGYRGHYDPVTGAALARDMLLAAGFAFAGENWYGHRNGPVAIAEAAMAWFMTDPPHAQGILNTRYSLVGVGIAFNGQQWLLVQNFAGY